MRATAQQGDGRVTLSVIDGVQMREYGGADRVIVEPAKRRQHGGVDGFGLGRIEQVQQGRLGRAVGQLTQDFDQGDAILGRRFGVGDEANRLAVAAGRPRRSIRRTSVMVRSDLAQSCSAATRSAAGGSEKAAPLMPRSTPAETEATAAGVAALLSSHAHAARFSSVRRRRISRASRSMISSRTIG